MPTLIHLNGPPGVGKSTLAERYVDAHPGDLNMDVDVVLSLIGGWRTDFFAHLAPARHLAVAMAAAHLRTGHDVVLPQLVTDVNESRVFEEAAIAAHARYVEVVLTAGPQERLARFRQRELHTEVSGEIARAVAGMGGDALLLKIDQDFSHYVEQRPRSLSLDTAGHEEGDAYMQLTRLL